jgi:hypothetical protein
MMPELFQDFLFPKINYLTTSLQSRNQKGISNNEQGTPNIEGRRRFAPYISSKRDCAFGAPSFDIPCSIFIIQSSHIQIMYNMLVDNFW